MKYPNQVAAMLAGTVSCGRVPKTHIHIYHLHFTLGAYVAWTTLLGPQARGRRVGVWGGCSLGCLRGAPPINTYRLTEADIHTTVQNIYSLLSSFLPWMRFTIMVLHIHLSYYSVANHERPYAKKRKYKTSVVMPTLFPTALHLSPSTWYALCFFKIYNVRIKCWTLWQSGVTMDLIRLHFTYHAFVIAGWNSYTIVL